MSEYQEVAYTYRNDERLIRATSGSDAYDLAYDALGRCVKRTLNNVTTYYIYDGEKPVLEYNSGGAIVARNVYGKWIDEILMRTDTTVNGGQPFYYQQDRNHNVTHLTNASGAVIETYKYDAFGAVTVYDGSGNLRQGGTAYKNRFLFTGREYAATFGFYEYRARAYNPTLGRFMSEDPKLFDGGDYNLFRYCHNDPLDRVDPIGLMDGVQPQPGDQATGPARYAVFGPPLGSHIPRIVPVPTAGLVEAAKALGGLIMGRVAASTHVQNDFRVVPKTTPHDGGDKHLRPGQRATTEASLEQPVGVPGPAGVIARQQLKIDIYFAKKCKMERTRGGVV